MNPKTIVKYILIILGIYIFAYIPLDTFVLNPAKKTIRFEVVEKRTGPYTESTGKYSSRTTDATFIRIRDENGSYETLTITDPFVSDAYVIGNTYVKDYHEKSNWAISFFVLIYCICVFWFCVGVCLVCIIFITILATVEWSFSDKYNSWLESFNSYF